MGSGAGRVRLGRTRVLITCPSPCRGVAWPTLVPEMAGCVDPTWARRPPPAARTRHGADTAWPRSSCWPGSHPASAARCLAAASGAIQRFALASGRRFGGDGITERGDRRRAQSPRRRASAELLLLAEAACGPPRCCARGGTTGTMAWAGSGLEGRLALVTGGARNRGGDRGGWPPNRRSWPERAAPGEGPANRRPDRGDGAGRPVPGDVASTDAVDALVGRSNSVGPVEILRNNAAILIMAGFELDPRISTGPSA
jgi:hypothetical protein